MVIGFDGSRASVGDKTGTENYSYQLLKALAKIDRKNKYIVYLRPNYSSNEVRSNLKNNNSFKGEFSLRSNNIEGWPKNFQFKKISWPRLWTQAGLGLQTFKDRLDVLFVPAHTLPVIRKPGLKTVVTVHDLGSEYLPSMHQLKQRLYLGFMLEFQLQTASKIIAVSKATKEDLVKRIGIDPNKIKVVYEGYNKDLFRPIKKDISVDSLKQYGLKSHNYVFAKQKGKVLRASSTIFHTASEASPYFLFVGTVQPRKNLIRLIAAYSQLLSEQLRTTQNTSGSDSPTNQNSDSSGSPSHSESFRNESFGIPKLVIVGSKGWLSDQIYSLPKKLGIENRVKFLGYVPDADLPALYCGAIALVFPSLFEGFGLPILEAQACGCPVVTSNISSMPEVAGSTSLKLRGVKDGAVYVNPYEVGDIVEGMLQIQNSKIKNQKVNEGFKNVKRFSWEKCAKETLEVLENI